MSAISILSFSIFVICLLSMIKKDADLFSPARLFALVWSFAIGLAELKLSRLQFYWNGYSWFILFLSISSVFLGMFIVYVLNINNNLKTIKNIREIVAKKKINTTILFSLIIAIFFAYLVSYVAIYLIVGFIPLFTAIPNEARTKWSVFGLGLIIHLAPAVIYLIVMFFLLIKREVEKKSFLAMLFVITLITFLLLLQRFGLVISIVLSLIFVYYGTFKFSPRNIILTFIFFAVFMFGISTLRVSSFFVEFFYYTSKMKIHHDYAFLSEPYMYVVMNLENFANATNKLENFTYGYFTFDFILALSGLKHWLATYTYLPEHPFLLSADFNTYGMFFVYYRDFGIIGVFMFPFLLGMISSHFYYKMRKNPDLNTITLYGICAFALLLSFFIPMLSWLNFVLNFSTLFLITKYVVHRSEG